MHEYFAISVHFVDFYTNFNRKNRFYGIEIKKQKKHDFQEIPWWTLTLNFNRLPFSLQMH